MVKFAKRNSCGYLLDVSENFHRNVYNEVLDEVVAYQNGIY